MVRDHWIEGQTFSWEGGAHTREEAQPRALGRLGCITGVRESAPGALSAWPPAELGASSLPLGASPGSRSPSELLAALQPHLHQAAAFTLGAHEQPRGEAGDLKERRHHDALRRRTRVGGQQGGSPSPWSRNTHRRCLQNLLVGPVQFESLLVVQVGGSQGDSEVDAASIRQDGILCQGLQSHARVLGTGDEVLSAPGRVSHQSPCPHLRRPGPSGGAPWTLSEGQRPMGLEWRANLVQTSMDWGPRQQAVISTEADTGSLSQSQMHLSLRLPLGPISPRGCPRR